MSGFPIDRCVYREYPTDYEGDVFICDIDRTYLATRISSWKGLARVPFEFAVDKGAEIAALPRVTVSSYQQKSPC